MSETFATLERLIDTIAKRAAEGDTQRSHTAKLLKKGTPKIAKKLGEEAVETALAAMTDDKEHVIEESADLLYHLLVLWQDQGITPVEVMSELKRRETISGIQEKLSRPEE